ncbi:ABC transporter permease [bacterium]|nr:ABC transporter permease [bacterium]
MLKEILKEFIQYRELLLALTFRNIKIRYKQTIMGFLWAIFMPTIVVLSGIMVKKAMSILTGKPLELTQIISITVKALPWAFFVGALKFSANSLVANMNIVKKIYFSKEVFPVSYVLAQLFDFLIAGTTLAIIFIFVKIPISIHILWIPLILAILVLITMGLAMILSCGNVFFRDVKYIADVVLTFGIFFTPVFYEAGMFGKWKTILLLNPVGSILEAINATIVLHKSPDIFWLIYAGIWALSIFVGGLMIFHKTEPLFAEKI